MPLFRRRRANDEVKSVDVLPEAFWEYLQSAPQLRNPHAEDAVGLPALLAVIRLLAHSAGMVPIHVLRDGDVREPARDTWQWARMTRRPGPAPLTPFALTADLAANFAGRGNAYVRLFLPDGRPAPDRPTVLAMRSLDAGKVKPRISATGDVVFDDGTGENVVSRGTREVLQVRSFSLGDGLEGLSPITAARLMITGALDRQRLESSHLQNGYAPGFGVQFPPGVSKAQADEWLEATEAKHRGSSKAGKILAVGGGATLLSVPVSLRDAQFAELTKLTIEQCCAMYQVPLSFFVAGAAPSEDDWRFLTTFALGPFFTAYTQALNASDQLFPERGEPLFTEALTDALLRPDTPTRYEMYRIARQGGWITANEVRRKENFPDVPGGDSIQETPVGGAPNASSGPTPPADPAGTP
ncbi:phage portal protein [Paraconexibacter algicola]|nr:phage portal protein [Paraconexibacter algicola]